MLVKESGSLVVTMHGGVISPMGGLLGPVIAWTMYSVTEHHNQRICLTKLLAAITSKSQCPSKY